jgi:hypothetical protein
MSAFTDEELLALVEAERALFTRSNKDLLRRYVDELVARRVYPSHWPGPTPYERMSGWGAYWHRYEEPLNCPLCNTDLRDQTWGPPGKREIGRSDIYLDRIVEWHCPDCKGSWPRL